MIKLKQEKKAKKEKKKTSKERKKKEKGKVIKKVKKRGCTKAKVLKPPWFKILSLSKNVRLIPLLNQEKEDLSKFLQRPCLGAEEKKKDKSFKRESEVIERKISPFVCMFFFFLSLLRKELRGEMNRGHVLQSTPVQQMMGGGNPNWWSINTNMRPPPPNPSLLPPPPPPSTLFPNHYAPLPDSSSWQDNNENHQQLPADSWSQLLL